MLKQRHPKRITQIMAIKKRPPTGRPLNVCKQALPFGPAIAFPVAAAFMLAEREFFARPPPPIVFVNDNVGVRRISVTLVGMPTDVAATDDGGGCANG